MECSWNGAETMQERFYGSEVKGKCGATMKRLCMKAATGGERPATEASDNKQRPRAESSDNEGRDNDERSRDNGCREWRRPSRVHVRCRECM